MGLLGDLTRILVKVGALAVLPGGKVGTAARLLLRADTVIQTVQTLQDAGLLSPTFPSDPNVQLTDEQRRELNTAVIQARERGVLVMPHRDPETGQFVSSKAGKGGRPVESPDLLVLDEKADVGTPYDDWETDEAGEGSWKVFEGPVQEDEVMLLYGVQTWVSDVNELDVDDPVQVWWFSGLGPLSEGGWTTKVQVPNFIAYHEFSQTPGGAVVEGRGSYAQDGIVTNFWQEWGGPYLNASGDVTINTEYLGAGAEIAWGIWYETVEVTQEHLLEELLEQSRQSLRGTRP